MRKSDVEHADQNFSSGGIKMVFKIFLLILYKKIHFLDKCGTVYAGCENARLFGFLQRLVFCKSILICQFVSMLAVSLRQLMKCYPSAGIVYGNILYDDTKLSYRFRSHTYGNTFVLWFIHKPVIFCISPEAIRVST